MSVLSPSQTWNLEPPSLPVYRFSVDDYHRLIQDGIITEDNDVELLEGLVVPKMGRNPPHETAIDLANERLRMLLPKGWRIRIQCAITTADSEPEPDLAFVRGEARDYLTRHPGPSDMALVVEVADATLTRDRVDKARLYARAGIVCYWIVNLVDRQLEVYTDPTGPGPEPHFRQSNDFLPNDEIRLVIDGKEIGRIPVADFLP
jgi:Uma2 family endonuclease